MSNPGVVADSDALPGPPVEEFLIIGLALEIGRGAIGEVMLGGASHGMHGGIDANMCGDIGELADVRIGNLRVVHAV